MNSKYVPNQCHLKVKLICYGGSLLTRLDYDIACAPYEIKCCHNYVSSFP